MPWVEFFEIKSTGDVTRVANFSTLSTLPVCVDSTPKVFLYIYLNAEYIKFSIIILNVLIFFQTLLTLPTLFLQICKLN